MAATVFTASYSSLSPCSHRNNKNQNNSFSSFSFSIRSRNKPRKSLKFTIRNEHESGARKKLSVSSSAKHSFGQNTQISFSIVTRENLSQPIKFSVKDEQESEKTSSSVAVVTEENESIKRASEASGHEIGTSKETESEEEKEKQQEMDWKTDEEFKKFMGNPSIEAAIKLEKKRADRKLKELDRQSSDNPLMGFFNSLVRNSLAREKERLEMAEETFKALDLNKVIIFLHKINSQPTPTFMEISL